MAIGSDKPNQLLLASPIQPSNNSQARRQETTNALANERGTRTAANASAGVERRIAFMLRAVASISCRKRRGWKARRLTPEWTTLRLHRSRLTKTMCMQHIASGRLAWRTALVTWPSCPCLSSWRCLSSFRRASSACPSCRPSHLCFSSSPHTFFRGVS